MLTVCPPPKKNNKSQVNSAHLKIREISHGIFAWIPSIHPIQCIYCHVAQSPEGFFLTSCKTKGSLQQTVENDLPALVKLTFYENLLIGLETGVRCPHKWVLSRFPYSGVPLYLADDSRCKLACDTL